MLAKVAEQQQFGPASIVPLVYSTATAQAVHPYKIHVYCVVVVVVVVVVIVDTFERCLFHMRAGVSYVASSASNRYQRSRGI